MSSNTATAQIAREGHRVRRAPAVGGNLVDYYDEGMAPKRNEGISTVVGDDFTPIVDVAHTHASWVEGVPVGNAVKIVGAVRGYIHGHTLGAEAAVGKIVRVCLVVAR